MTRRALVLLVVLLPAAVLFLAASPESQASRPADKDCKWERFEDRSLGLGAWVERCNYGGQRIDFLRVKNALAQRYSDHGDAEPVVEVFDLQAGETPAAGVERIFRAHTEAKLAARCVRSPYTDSPSPVGVERFTFLPDAKYQKELDAKADADQIPDPPCGDWGFAPDGIQYFETQPGSPVKKILFVRVGQDIPLFDETQLRLLPPK